MPVFNRQDLVTTTVCSLLQQTHKELELIIVDDGSTDLTPDLIANINDTRIKFIRNEDNQGNLVRRNQAFEHVSGEYIAIMDSDDICHPNRLSLQIAKLRQGFDMCGCAQTKGQSLAGLHSNWVLPTDPKEMAASCLFGSPMPHPSLIMTKAFFDEYGFKYDPSYFPAADYHAIANAVTTPGTRATAVEEILLFRRLHKSAISTENELRQQRMAEKICSELLTKLGASAEQVLVHAKVFNKKKISQSEIDVLEDLYFRTLVNDNHALFGNVQAIDLFDRKIREARKVRATSKKGKNAARHTPHRPDVSFVVPIYNTSAFLTECIDSIFAQKGLDCEIILVNDGSTDNSLEICEAYAAKHSSIKIIDQANAGLSAARNIGVRHAFGQYVFFLDSDDILVPNSISVLLKAAKANDADVSVGSHFAFDESSRTETPIFQAKKDRFFASQILVSYCDREFGYPAANKLIKRTIANRVSFEVDLLHEDELYCADLFTLARSVYVSKHKTYLYRQRDGSITSEVGKKHILAFCRVLELIIERAQFLQGADRDDESFTSLLEFKIGSLRHKSLQIESIDLETRARVEQVLGVAETELLKIRLDVEASREAVLNYGPQETQSFRNTPSVSFGRGFNIAGRFIRANAREIARVNKQDAFVIASLLPRQENKSWFVRNLRQKSRKRQLSSLGIVAYSVRKCRHEKTVEVFRPIDRLFLLFYSILRR